MAWLKPFCDDAAKKATFFDCAIAGAADATAKARATAPSSSVMDRVMSMSPFCVLTHTEFITLTHPQPTIMPT